MRCENPNSWQTAIDEQFDEVSNAHDLTFQRIFVFRYSAIINLSLPIWWEKMYASNRFVSKIKKK